MSLDIEDHIELQLLTLRRNPRVTLSEPVVGPVCRRHPDKFHNQLWEISEQPKIDHLERLPHHERIRIVTYMLYSDLSPCQSLRYRMLHLALFGCETRAALKEILTARAEQAEAALAKNQKRARWLRLAYRFVDSFPDDIFDIKWSMQHKFLMNRVERQVERCHLRLCDYVLWTFTLPKDEAVAVLNKNLDEIGRINPTWWLQSYMQIIE